LPMPLNDPEKILLDALKALPPNTVYSDTGKKEIVSGFRMYTSAKVEHVAWDGREGTLAVIVDEGGGMVVRMTFEDGRVVSRCGCKVFSLHGKCGHVVCAFLTIIHLLKPNLFKMTVEDPHYRDRLLAELLNEQGVERDGLSPESNVVPFERLKRFDDGVRKAARGVRASVYEVVIEENRGRVKAYVEQDGERIESFAHIRFLPQELGYLVGFSRRDDMSVPLSIFLKKWGKDYRIIFREGIASHHIVWRDDISCNTWTEVDAWGEEVLVSKKCAMDGDPSPASLLGNFALNAERTKICHVKDRSGWELWKALRDVSLRGAHASEGVRETGDWVLNIPSQVFTRFQLSFNKPEGGSAIPAAVFKVNGAEAAPSVSTVGAYEISVTRSDKNEGEFILKPVCRANEHQFNPSRRVLSFVRAVEWGRVPMSLRTRKRKPILYDMFFQAFALRKNRKALDEKLKNAINERTFGKPQFASLARRLIRESVAKWNAEAVQLHLTDQGWQFVELDRERELALFSVPYEVFGPALFERVILDHSSMVVIEEEFLQRLHILTERAASRGIEVHLEGHLVDRASWEFELDAREGSIDWFEIRPEIRCNGETIERELWEQALKRKGVFYHNGKVQVLDETTMETLSALAGLTGGSKTAGKALSKEIVSVPRLKIIEILSLRKKGITVRLTPGDEELVARLTQFDKIESKPLPEGLVGELRHYQREGYSWLAFLYEHRFGACLADDMGLGKTIQAIVLLAAIREGKIWCGISKKKPSLIVMPPSLLFNWEQEIAKFCPGLKVYVYRGKDRSTALDGYDVVLTSYGLVRRDIARLRDMYFDAIIFDEAQAIKNIVAGTTGAVRQLKGAFKMALTGTPVENHIGEYYSIMDLVLPGLLGDYKEFQGKARHDMAAFLPGVVERTKPFVLRRTKERILKELPPKIENDVYLDLTERQKKFYNRTVEEVRSTIEDAYRNNTASQAKIVALTAIMKLRQICLTPELLVEDQKEMSPKVEFLKDKLEQLCSESHSSLVFSQFTSFLDVVEEELKTKGFRIFRLDGSTPVVKRRTIVEGFQDCETPAVFLLSLKAGGQGLNLTRASYVFHLDPWWNPAVENQASDRSHRIGQKKKVIVTRLLMRHTVEEKMMALKQRKLSLYRALMDAPEESAGKAITREDFNFLLGLG
jgi:superfamily II DNA or RNA helicase